MEGHRREKDVLAYFPWKWGSGINDNEIWTSGPCSGGVVPITTAVAGLQHPEEESVGSWLLAPAVALRRPAPRHWQAWALASHRVCSVQQWGQGPPGGSSWALVILFSSLTSSLRSGSRCLTLFISGQSYFLLFFLSPSIFCNHSLY